MAQFDPIKVNQSIEDLENAAKSTMQAIREGFLSNRLVVDQQSYLVQKQEEWNRANDPLGLMEYWEKLDLRPYIAEVIYVIGDVFHWIGDIVQGVADWMGG